MSMKSGRAFIMICSLAIMSVAAGCSDAGGKPRDTGNSVLSSASRVNVVSTRAMGTALKVPARDRMDHVRIGPADFADAGSTAVGLASGLVEANPIAAAAGNAAPLVLIPLKYGAKKVMVASGFTPARANWLVETAGTFATCNNLAALSGGVPPVAIGVGIICGVIYAEQSKSRYERRNSRSLDGGSVSRESVPEIP